MIKIQELDLDVLKISSVLGFVLDFDIRISNF